MVYFSKEHEWVRVEGKTAVIGITEYAAEELGDITYVEMPREGDLFARGEVICEIESVKAAGEVYAPVSGKVIETNPLLVDEPEQAGENPRQEGWILKMEISDPSETGGLMDETDYSRYLETLG